MIKVLLVSIFTTMLLQACATPKVSVKMLMPAKFSEPAKYKRIAVLPFKGAHGEEVSEQLEAKLVNMRIDEAGNLWFDVYERERLKAALRELRLGRSGLVDPDSAAKLGRFIGVQGVYIGRVNTYKTDYKYYNETRTYCAVKNKKGKCLEMRDTTVKCKRRQVAFEFTPKLVDVESARVVYSSPHQRSISSSVCNGSFRYSDETVMRDAMSDALTFFAKDVAPHYEYARISIKNSADDLQGKAEEYFKSGVAFAKENRLDRGCKLWKSSKGYGGNSMPLLYNLGVCAEYRGDFEGADEWYHQADEMLMKPDKEVSAALRRISYKRDQRRKLNGQMKTF